MAEKRVDNRDTVSPILSKTRAHALYTVKKRENRGICSHYMNTYSLSVGHRYTATAVRHKRTIEKSGKTRVNERISQTLDFSINFNVHQRFQKSCCF